MSRSLSMSFKFALRFVVVCSFGIFGLWSAASENHRESRERSASVIRYDVPGGETLFALSLKGDAKDKQAAHDHVILIDTSASQAGAHRRQGLAVLDSCLASLAASDRVRVFAVDVQVKSLSDGFFAPQSAETKAALAQLQGRVPLGATSLQPALNAALKSFAGPATAGRGRSIIYIGDGMSTGE